MKIIKPYFRNNTLYKKVNSFTTDYEPFRFGGVKFSKFMSVFFNNGSLENPLDKFKIITKPLYSGTYKYKINSLDNLDNVNTGTEKSIAITNRPYYVSSLSYTLSGNDVTLTWIAPVNGSTPTSYKVYGNGGSGYEIDRSTILDTVVGLTSTITVADGDWIFVVETVSNTLETIHYDVVKMTVPVDETVPIIPVAVVDEEEPVQEETELQLVNVQLTNVSVGKCKISFYWVYGSEASYFRIYHDEGTGTIDWNNYKFRFARINNLLQTYTTTQISTSESKEYKFGIRSENSYGNIDANTNEYTVNIDGIAPDEVEDFNASLW
jgi:hypothetical protein